MYVEAAWTCDFNQRLLAHLASSCTLYVSVFTEFRESHRSDLHLIFTVQTIGIRPNALSSRIHLIATHRKPVVDASALKKLNVLMQRLYRNSLLAFNEAFAQLAFRPRAGTYATRFDRAGSLSRQCVKHQIRPSLLLKSADSLYFGPGPHYVSFVRLVSLPRG